MDLIFHISTCNTSSNVPGFFLKRGHFFKFKNQRSGSFSNWRPFWRIRFWTSQFETIWTDQAFCLEENASLSTFCCNIYYFVTKLRLFSGFQDFLKTLSNSVFSNLLVVLLIIIFFLFVFFLCFSGYKWSDTCIFSSSSSPPCCNCRYMTPNKEIILPPSDKYSKQLLLLLRHPQICLIFRCARKQ